MIQILTLIHIGICLIGLIQVSWAAYVMWSKGNDLNFEDLSLFIVPFVPILNCVVVISMFMIIYDEYRFTPIIKGRKK